MGHTLTSNCIIHEVEEGIVEYLKRDSEEKIQQLADQEISSLSRDARRKASSESRQRVKDAIDASNKGHDEVEQILRVMQSVIPYDKMLVSEDGFVIPLEKTYFRVNSKNIGFKFGGSMTCMGIISNIIGKGSAPVKEDDFSQLCIRKSMRL